MKHEIGLSIRSAHEDVFTCGLIDCIEYSIGADFNLADAYEVWEKNKNEIVDMCKRHGVKLNSYHLPFNGERFNGVYMHAPSSLSAEIRERTLEHTKRLIDGIRDTGVRFVILHGSLRVPEEERVERVGVFVEYVQRLADYCKPYGITVAVETLLESCIGGGGERPENRIPEMRYIMENVNRDNVGICLDNNHFIKSDCLDFVRALGKYVVTTHFSDYYGTEECHNFPGDGITDWRELTRLLLEAGYTGPWLFEVKFPEGKPTDERLRELIGRWNSLMNENA